MWKHKVALNKSGIIFAGITTTIKSSMLLSWAVLQLHNSIYLRIGTGTVSYEKGTPQLLSMWDMFTTTIYVGVHTVCLLSMWECILYA